MPTPRLTSRDPIKTRNIAGRTFTIFPAMRLICACVCLAVALERAQAAPAPADGFVFPDERRREKKLEPVITPPVLPYIEHLERDPSTLLPNERERASPGSVKPRFGFGGGFNVAPTGNGGLTASVSSSANGGGASHSASQSFSFGFNEGFSASHSASQASSFNGFNSGFSGSQASSQAASFGGSGGSLSGSASQASAFGGHGGSVSQSASQAFGLNSLGGFQPHEATFGDGLLDVRHRGIPNFPFPDFGRSKGVGAASFRSSKSRPLNRNRNADDFLAVLVSNS